MMLNRELCLKKTDVEFFVKTANTGSGRTMHIHARNWIMSCNKNRVCIVRPDPILLREMESGIEAIRRRLIAAENSGFTDMTIDEIWEEARQSGQVSPE